MEKGNYLKNSQIIILGICLGLATIIASLILSQGALRIMQFSKETVTVTGSAQKEIRSDYIVWSGRVARQDHSLPAAYQALKDDLQKVMAYLKDKKIKEAELTVSPVQTEVLHREDKSGERTGEIGAYRLSQTVEIRSRDVEQVALVARESTELISQGIEFVSNSPDFFYTALDTLKVEMLALATRNAQQRAERIAASVGMHIGAVRSVRMGVFQITPLMSTEIADYGVNDTSSLEKKITSVVSASFAIE